MKEEREKAFSLMENIIKLFLKRREVVKEIGRIKKELGLPIEDIKRELEIREKLLSKGIPIEDEMVGKLFNFLILDALMQQGWRMEKEKYAEEGLIDLSLHLPFVENPYGILKLASQESSDLPKMLSSRLGFKVEEILISYTRETAIFAILKSLLGGRFVCIPKPSNPIYYRLAWSANCRPIWIDNGEPLKYLIVGFPHDPTGEVPNLKSLNDLECIIIDGTYYDFTEERITDLAENTIFIYGLSTPFGLPFPTLIIGEKAKEVKRVHEILFGKTDILSPLVLAMLRSKGFWSLNDIRVLRKKVVSELRDASIKLVSKEGLFLLFYDEKKRNVYELALKAGVKVISGEDLGLPQYYFALNPASKDLENGIKRIKDVL